MEYASCGNLRNMMRASAFQNLTLSEENSMAIFAQLVLGMSYIHSKKIIHRDLKPENILLDAGGRILLCDFGLSKVLPTFSAKAQTFTGSLPYMPPEILMNEAYGSSVDVWAAGLILLELLTGKGKLVFQGQTREEVLFDIIQKTSISFPKHISQATKELVLSIIAKDAAQRPTFAELARHP